MICYISCTKTPKIWKMLEALNIHKIINYAKRGAADRDRALCEHALMLTQIKPELMVAGSATVGLAIDR